MSGESELVKKNHLLNLAEKMVMIGHWQWFLSDNSVLWSDNLYTLFQHDRAKDISYDTYFGYVHPDDKEYVTECVEKSIADKEFHGFYHRILLQDGSVKEIHLLGTIYLDDEGNVSEMIGTCQDVTAQKEAESKLAESENLYRYLYDHAHAMHFSVRPSDGVIIKCNETLCNTLLYDREELVGSSVFRLFPAGQIKQSIGMFKEFRERDMAQNKEFRIVKKNGSIIDVLLSASSVRDSNDDILYHRVSCIDVSENVSTAKKLKIQNQRLSDFCSIISHNLRGPLTNISMISDFLGSTSLDDSQREIVDELHSVVGHLNEVFNELVESISVQYDTAKTREKLDLNHEFNGVRDSLANRIKACNAEIEVDFTKAPNVYFPKEYVKSIFSNLLSNALQYRSPHRPLAIQVRSVSRPGSVVLSMRDNGLGLDVETHRHNLFKIRKVFHDHPDAKGFGLFMTRMQLEAMDGSIWVESKPDAGATFYVSFPNEAL
ncbi:MAG: PAS domain S-box protein [Cryomorphaceae bacterium]